MKIRKLSIIYIFIFIILITCNDPGASLKEIVTPELPEFLSATAVSGTGVTLHWTDTADNEESYTVERNLDGAGYATLAGGLSANTESYSDTGFTLDEDHNLEYRVLAVNSAGTSGYSNTASVAYEAPETVPETPVGLSATAVSGTGVTLHWTDTADNEESYTVERNLDGAGYATLAGGLSANTESYSDTGFTLDEDHNLEYRVLAVNSAGTSGYSNTASVAYEAPETVPETPVGLSATAVSGTGVILHWTDTADNEESYTVERNLDGAGYATLAGGLSANTESYSDTGFTLDEDHNLEYRVLAVNSAGTSGYSNTASVAYEAPETVPETPVGLSATAVSGTGATLHWTDTADNEESYTVERNLDGAGYATLAGGLSANTESYSDTGFTLDEDHNLEYRVLAVNSAGTSGYSNTASVAYEAPETVPETPVGLSATAVSGTGVTLHWTDTADNEESYTVERNLDGAGYATLAGGLSANTESYSDTGFTLDEDHNLEYRVLAVNSAGTSGYSNTASVAYEAPETVPETPVGLSATAVSGTGVILHWTDTADNEESYTVERNLDGAGYATLAGGLSANTESYSDTGFTLDEDHNLEYRVLAVNSAGTSGYSNTASVAYEAPETVPETPVGLSATAVSGTGVTLHWTDTADNEESYTVERNLDGAGYATLAGGLSANTESYSDTGFTLDEDHNLEYRVLAVNSAGTSGYSNTASVAYEAPLPKFIIIDHEAIEEFDSLTADQLTEAKKVLIIIAGESHGRAYGYGLELVEASDGSYDSSVNWDGEAEGYTEEHLRFNQYYRYNGDWEQYGGEEEFYTNSVGRNRIIDGLHYMDEKLYGHHYIWFWVVLGYVMAESTFRFS